MQVNDRLYRSVDDRVIAGVAGGLAERMGLDPSLVRIIWALLIIASSGVFLVIYIVMAVIVPEAPDGWAPRGIVGGGTPGGGAPGGAWAGGAGTGWGPPPTSWPPDWQRQHDGVRPGIDTERAGIVVGLFLVVLGGWFLLDEYLHVDWALVWPVAVMAVGAALILGAARRGR
jgi:phage shock protein C